MEGHISISNGSGGTYADFFFFFPPSSFSTLNHELEAPPLMGTFFLSLYMHDLNSEGEPYLDVLNQQFWKLENPETKLNPKGNFVRSQP